MKLIATIISIFLISSIGHCANLPEGIPSCSDRENAILKRSLLAFVSRDSDRKRFPNDCVDCSFTINPSDAYLGKTDSGKDQWKFAITTKSGKCYTYFLINTKKTQKGNCTIFGEPIESHVSVCEG